MIFRRKEANNQHGFFVPAVLLVFLVVIFMAILFGSRLLEKSEPVDVQFSARYHELRNKEFLTEEEMAELELERCRFDRDLLLHIRETDAERFEKTKASYEIKCQDKLPL